MRRSAMLWYTSYRRFAFHAVLSCIAVVALYASAMGYVEAAAML